MSGQLRFLVLDQGLQAELGGRHPSARISSSSGEPDHGFGETLYPILVDAGAVALPASVLAGVLATWLVEAWKRRGSPPNATVGVERGEKIETLTLSDADVERIALRLKALLEAEEDGGDGIA